MKRSLALFSIAFLSALFVAFASPGCSNPCEDLASVCARCGDAGYRASCEAIVAKGTGSVCSSDIANFQTFCTNDGQAGGGGGAVASECIASETKCVGTCANLSANATFCGSCNTQCKDGELCIAAECVQASECPSTLPDPNESGGCTDRDRDPSCCGPSCSRCSDALACVNGTCAPPETCVGDLCTGACTSVFDDPLNCGKCGLKCKAGEVCANGQCASTCGDQLTQCCGKCVDVSSNAIHCGGCDPSCPEAQGGQGGQGGGTAEPSNSEVCPLGYQSCSGNTPVCSSCLCVSEDQCTVIEQKTVCDGTCVDLQADPKHCGACGNSCGGDKKCANGVCISGDCPVGQTACGGSCADLQTDPNYCGSCDSACDLSKGELCNAGVCATACTPPLQQCGASCVDTSKDPKNCGACAKPCGAGEVCAVDTDKQVKCLSSCPDGLTNCGGACVDLRSDFNHCGSCGNTCNDDNVCTADSCTFGADGGKCENASGAKLCPGTEEPCKESTCDPKLGCVIKPLTPAAIAAGCSLAAKPPGGWSSDDLKDGQAYCLWCDNSKEKAADACTYALRSDSASCTIDSCSQDRLSAPTHAPDDGACSALQKCCKTSSQMNAEYTCADQSSCVP